MIYHDYRNFFKETQKGLYLNPNDEAFHAARDKTLSTFSWLQNAQEFTGIIFNGISAGLYTPGEMSDMIDDAINLFEQYVTNFSPNAVAEPCVTPDNLGATICNLIQFHSQNAATDEKMATIRKFWNLCAHILAGDCVQDFLADIYTLMSKYREVTTQNYDDFEKAVHGLYEVHSNVKNAAEIIKLVTGYLKHRQKEIQMFENTLECLENKFSENLVKAYWTIDSAKGSDDGLYMCATLIKEYSPKKSNFQILLESLIPLIAELEAPESNS